MGQRLMRARSPDLDGLLPCSISMRWGPTYIGVSAYELDVRRNDTSDVVQTWIAFRGGSSAGFCHPEVGLQLQGFFGRAAQRVAMVRGACLQGSGRDSSQFRFAPRPCVNGV